MTLWYIARAAGLMALAALTLATALGAFATVRQTDDGPPAHRLRFVLQYLHRSAAVTGLILLVLHIGSLVLDAKSGVNLRSVVIPFSSSYRPVAVTIGMLALDAVLLTSLSGALRGRLASSVRASRWWRVIHLSAYVGWGMAMAHGFFAGTDTSLPLVRLGYLAAWLTVGLAWFARFWSQRAAAESPLAQSRQRVLASSGRRSS